MGLFSVNGECNQGITRARVDVARVHVQDAIGNDLRRTTDRAASRNRRVDGVVRLRGGIEIPDDAAVAARVRAYVTVVRSGKNGPRNHNGRRALRIRTAGCTPRAADRRGGCTPDL